MKQSRKKQRRSLQNDYILLREIHDDTLYLGSVASPIKRELVVCLHVQGTNLALKSIDEQRSLLDRWRDLLLSLPYPIQILTRILPLDLRRYRAQFIGSTQELEGEVEHQLREEHLALIQQVEQSHTLFERTSYLLVPSRTAQPAARATGAFVREFLWPPLRKRRLRQHRQETFQQLQQQLDMRVRDLSRLLARMLLPALQLDGEHLLHFYASCVLAIRALAPIKPALIRALDQPLVTTPRLLAPEHDVSSSGGLPGEQPLVRLLPLEHELPAPVNKRRVKSSDQQALRGSFSRVADLVTPAGLILKPNHVRLLQDGDEFLRTLVIDEMPRDIMIGWLKPLLEINEPYVDVCMYIVPRPKVSALAQMRRKRTSYKAARYFSQKHGYLIDDDSQVAEDDADALSRKVASGEEHMHDVTCFVVLRAVSEEELDARTDRVMAILDTLQVVARPAFLQQDEGYRSALPHVQNTLAQRGSLFLDTTSTAMAFFPFLANSLFMESGVLLGTTSSGDPISIDTWAFNNANAIFVGPSGYGKSFLKKVWTMRLLLKRHRERRQYIFFDPEREYESLCKAFGGEQVRLASGSPHRINLFDLFYFQESTYEGDRLAEKIAWLRELFAIMLGHHGPGGLTPPKPELLGLLERACYEAYRRVGITSNATARGRQAPLLRDVYDILEKKAEQQEETYDLLSLLYPYVYGSYRSFFDGSTNVHLESDVIVFDTRELTPEIAPVVLSVLADFVWSATFKHDMLRELIIDEANILSNIEAWARFMVNIVTRARKHGLGVTLIIQDMERFQANPYAKNLIDNCDLKVVVGKLRTSTVKNEFDLSDREEDLVSTFGPGEVLIITPTQRVTARIEAGPLEYKIGTTKASEVYEREHPFFQQPQQLSEDLLEGPSEEVSR